MAGAALQRRLTWLLANVVDVVTETPRVRSILLECPGWPGHLPGQHVDVRLTAEDGYQAQRSYSIAGPPDGDQITLTIELIPDGEVSPYLVEELRVGDGLELRGPIGGYFVLRLGSQQPLLLVGGGSGVVPLMAMLRFLAKSGDHSGARLLFSSRSWEDIIYRRELEVLAGQDTGVSIFHVLTRSQPPGWAGFRRRVDREMLAEVAWPPDDNPTAFVCGPTGFVEQVATGLVELGHDPTRVLTERFGPTGTP